MAVPGTESSDVNFGGRKCISELWAEATYNFFGMICFSSNVASVTKGAYTIRIRQF